MRKTLRQLLKLYLCLVSIIRVPCILDLLYSIHIFIVSCSSVQKNMKGGRESSIIRRSFMWLGVVWQSTAADVHIWNCYIVCKGNYFSRRWYSLHLYQVTTCINMLVDKTELHFFRNIAMERIWKNYRVFSKKNVSWCLFTFVYKWLTYY